MKKNPKKLLALDVVSSLKITTFCAHLPMIAATYGVFIYFVGHYAVFYLK